MEREEVSMMWHCPYCETKGHKLFGDFRVNWHPEKHGREHILFPVQTALRNTLQGHSWNCCQIWWRWNHCASLLSPAYFSQKCSPCSCSAWPVNANRSPQCSVPECTPSAFKWLLELRDCLIHFRNPQLLPGHQICINCLVSAISAYLDTIFSNPTEF